jgi:hypothetical protein
MKILVEIKEAQETTKIMINVKSLLKYCYRLENLTTEFPLLKDAFVCSKNLHFTHSPSWYSSVNKLLKIFNIQDNSMWYNKSKFGVILRKCLNQKYLFDWKDTSEWKTYHIFIFKDQF